MNKMTPEEKVKLAVKKLDLRRLFLGRYSCSAWYFGKWLLLRNRLKKEQLDLLFFAL